VCSVQPSFKCVYMCDNRPALRPHLKMAKYTAGTEAIAEFRQAPASNRRVRQRVLAARGWVEDTTWITETANC
jgi:hypothetical protein